FAASQRSEPLDARLQDELQKLELLTRQTAERNSKTFEAIHDTLVKIVSRLGALEAEGRAGVIEEPAPHSSAFMDREGDTAVGDAPQVSAPESEPTAPG